MVLCTRIQYLLGTIIIPYAVAVMSVSRERARWCA